jgi:hypothetical protein
MEVGVREGIWLKSEIQDGHQGLIFDEKMTILPLITMVATK